MWARGVIGNDNEELVGAKFGPNIHFCAHTKLRIDHFAGSPAITVLALGWSPVDELSNLVYISESRF